jgi:hypothetical protein
MSRISSFIMSMARSMEEYVSPHYFFFKLSGRKFCLRAKCDNFYFLLLLYSEWTKGLENKNCWGPTDAKFGLVTTGMGGNVTVIV